MLHYCSVGIKWKTAFQLTFYNIMFRCEVQLLKRYSDIDQVIT